VIGRSLPSGYHLIVFQLSNEQPGRFQHNIPGGFGSREVITLSSAMTAQNINNGDRYRFLDALRRRNRYGRHSAPGFICLEP
jgi:hypothetical protein